MMQLHAKAKALVLQLLPGSVVTGGEIESTLDQVLAMLKAMHPDAEFDRETLLRELEAALNIFQAEDVMMPGEERNEEWVARRKDIEWRFWERYLRYARESLHLPPAVLDRLDRTTVRILGQLEDPDRPGAWDRRGMVVGQVQSGKTGNYTGLICRAADAGYSLIVVLAGIHNSLRSQTQFRLDAGFLGFDTQRRQQSDTDVGFAAAALGVGRLVGVKPLLAASLTTSRDNGDFGIAKANSAGIPIGGFPVLLVVKKHTKILENLRQWVLEMKGTGEPTMVRDVPLLLIDDEADNASINTAQVLDPTGAYNPDLDPTRVNGAIRRLLNSFEQKAYVGYTATPYANIYIDPDQEHPEWGRDLFPSDFIEYLPAPSNYVGPAQLFGWGEQQPMELFRGIVDHDPWLPDRHKIDHRLGALPQSLRHALRSFVLVRAARLARGQERRHNSMLVHVTRFVSVQQAVRDQLQEELDDLRGRIRFGDGDGPSIRDELRELWSSDFAPTSAGWNGAGVDMPAWETIEALLEEAVEPIELRLINGTATDALEYFENETAGLNVIAVGGNSLSRGLTLEGLSVSYYLRAAGAYDTLLQMGRWFGYRDGYANLCRLYTTPNLWLSYRGVTAANEELINEFREMADRGARPRDFGLKVNNSVAGMLVTAPNKMRQGKKLRVGFAGSAPETVVLPSDQKIAGENLAVANDFISALGEPHDPYKGNFVWRGVDGGEVAELFFARLRTTDTAWRVHAPTIAAYIRNRVGAQELLDWTVMLVSSTSKDARTETIGGLTVGLTLRSLLKSLKDRLRDGTYSIRRILSPADEAVDLDEEQYRLAVEMTRQRRIADGDSDPELDHPAGWAVRRVRDVSRGLLLIYPLLPPDLTAVEWSAEDDPLSWDVTKDPLIGFAVSFPASPGAPAMDYVVNQRFLEELTGEVA